MMKKILLGACALFAALSLGFAQDVNEATDLYNNGANALALGDKAGALEYFQKAYNMAKEVGEAGEEIAANCEGVIPSLALQIAKDALKAGDYDTAVTKFEEAKTIAAQFGVDATAAEAESLIPQVYVQKGSQLLKSKDYAGAVEAYNKALELDPNNGRAALYLGQAYERLNDTDKAVEAYTLASTLGQNKTADKQLSKIYLKQANAANKAKNYSAALEAANKSNSYLESPEAYYIAAFANQNLGNNDGAISCFEKYLELKPGASNASAVKFTVAALYQGQKNNAKALEYYKMVENDPTYGAQAQQQIKALSK